MEERKKAKRSDSLIDMDLLPRSEYPPYSKLCRAIDIL